MNLTELLTEMNTNTLLLKQLSINSKFMRTTCTDVKLKLTQFINIISDIIEQQNRNHVKLKLTQIHQYNFEINA